MDNFQILHRIFYFLNIITIPTSEPQESKIYSSIGNQLSDIICLCELSHAEVFHSSEGFQKVVIWTGGLKLKMFTCLFWI